MNIDFLFDNHSHDFKIGEDVEFEIGNFGSFNLPRWHEGSDRGGTNVWATGKITEVTNDDIVVRYRIDGYVGYGICTFPNYGNRYYYDWQWSREGFLRKRPKILCQCGSDIVYGASNVFHSDWCPKKKEIDLAIQEEEENV